MAQGGERRMLFDIRGKRKHVVRVVYAILALLMGASLFLVVGPVNIGSLVGNSTTTTDAAKIFEENAERIEGRLKANPEDPNLLVSLSRERLNAGKAGAQVDPTTGLTELSAEGRAQIKQANQAWAKYLTLVKKGEASSATANLIAGGAFILAQNSTTYEEAFEHLDEAAAAQRIAAESQPNIGTLSQLALFELLGGNFAAGDKAGKEAEAHANSKQQKKQLNQQLDAYRKQGKELQKNKKAAEKAEKGKGKETLENPLGGLGGSSSSSLSP